MVVENFCVVQYIIYRIYTYQVIFKVVKFTNAFHSWKRTSSNYCLSGFNSSISVQFLLQKNPLVCPCKCAKSFILPMLWNESFVMHLSDKCKLNYFWNSVTVLKYTANDFPQKVVMQRNHFECPCKWLVTTTHFNFNAEYAIKKFCVRSFAIHNAH